MMPEVSFNSKEKLFKNNTIMECNIKKIKLKATLKMLKAQSYNKRRTTQQARNAH